MTIANEPRNLDSVASAAPYDEAAFRGGVSLMAAELQPKLYRDLWGRRVWREWRNRSMRMAYLVASDTGASLLAWKLAVLVVVAAEAPRHLDLAIAAGVLGQAILGTYRAGMFRKHRDRIAAGVAATFVLMQIVAVRSDAPTAGALASLIFAALLLPTLMLSRWAAERLVRLAHRHGIARKSTLIVGTDDDAWEVVEYFRRTGERSLNIIGHLSPTDAYAPGAIGTTQELPFLIEEHDIEHVVVAGRIPLDSYFRIARESLLRGATVGAIDGLIDKELPTATFRSVGGWPALQLRVERLDMMQVAVKRLMDVLLSLVLLALASPMLTLLAMLVRLESPGPVFFRQRRPGLGGRPFHMLKFRSMRADAEEILHADEALYRWFVANGCKFPAGEDPRISRFGQLLRSSSLDELPQLFNVLVGDMSLVGPRPVVGPELEHFGSRAAAIILSVKPGMTGLWQVSGRSTIGAVDRADLDMEYVAKWSLRLDLEILLRTVPAVLRRSGAH